MRHRGPDQHSMPFIEKSLSVVGLGIKNFNEFAAHNLDAFNMVVEDSDRVKYFSFGSKKRELQISELLRPGYEIITDRKI